MAGEKNDIKLLFDTLDELKGQLDLSATDEKKLREKLKNDLIAKNCDKRIIECVSEEPDLRRLMSALYDSTRFQICFLVDVTGSIKPYDSLTSQFIATVMQSVLELKIPNAKFSYAFVGYRERNEKIEITPFTNDGDKIIKAIRDTKKEGGGDTCEDVEYGFKKLIEDVEWERTGTRILIHVADAPCHGSRYHDANLGDEHPEWSDELPKYFKKLVNVVNVLYWFVKITPHTDKMIKEFKLIMESIKKDDVPEEVYQIYEIDLKNVKKKLKESIKQLLQASMLTQLKSKLAD